MSLPGPRAVLSLGAGLGLVGFDVGVLAELMNFTVSDHALSQRCGHRSSGLVWPREA